MTKIDAIPKVEPARDPNDARFWDARDLEHELRRVFEICHNCRMCVNYCGSFPEMFARVDRDIAHGAVGAEALAADDFTRIVDLCWQCKLCYIKCPYTPDEGHEWKVDLPRLLLREKAQRAARNGIAPEDIALGEPARLGRLASGLLSGPMNLVNQNALLRKVNAKVLGISSEFPVPPFAATTFESWLKSHVPIEGAGSAGTVAMFATCLGDYNFPSVAANAVRVLERNGFAVTRPPQDCCGMPNLDGGDIAAAREKIKSNVRWLLGEVEAGRPIVAIQPTCAYAIKKEWPEIVADDDTRRVAAATSDVMEFLDRLRKDRKLVRPERGLGKVAYHAPCHLRAQKIGAPGARILGLLPETEVDIIEECSAVDGTWGMKEEYYAMGRRYAQKLVRGIEGAAAQVVVSDCQLAGQRIAHENRVDVVHPVQALARAYDIEVGVS